MNVSAIPATTVVGRLLRAPLRLIPGTTILPILQGRLRGKKWVVGSGRHAYWLGSYEYEKQAAFANRVHEGGIVFDIGGHVGFYTLLASNLVGPKGQVVTFEPLPRNLRYLRQHLALNGARNVLVIESAVSDKSGQARFAEGRTSDVGTIDEMGTTAVRTVAIDDLTRARDVPLPDVIKIDVEGAEGMVLRGARETLAKSHPTIFVATHNERVHEEVLAELRLHGYRTTLIGAVSTIEQSPEILAEFG